MQKHFMLDIETTGIDPGCSDLLQIGLLEATYDGKYWQAGKSLELTQMHTGQPETDFALKYQRELYVKCNAAPWQRPRAIRDQLIAFFAECGAYPPDVYFMGKNAASFDVPYLCHQGYLVPSGYKRGPDGKDIRTGDFHYRIYDMTGAILLFKNAFGLTDNELFTKTITAAGRQVSRVSLPAGGPHDALYDCYTQLEQLNGLLRLTRGITS